MFLFIILCLVVVVIVVNFWLGMCIGMLCYVLKVLVGDGGYELLLWWMWVQVNFVESVLFMVILVVVVEFVGKGGVWFVLVGVVFMFG